MWPNTGPNPGDLLIIYVILTPMTVLYWFTTSLMLNQWFGNPGTLLAVGFTSALVFVLLHEMFKNLAPSGGALLGIYETVYDYIEKLSCLCYILGCQVIYDSLRNKAKLEPAQVAGVAALLLIFVRGFRNVLTVPLTVNNDNDLDRYRPVSTLTFASERPMVDDLARILVVWTSVGVFWDGVVDALAARVDRQIMLLAGYIAVFLLMTFLRDLGEGAASQTDKEIVKVLVEDAYIGMAAIAGIMVWIGLEANVAAHVVSSVAKVKSNVSALGAMSEVVTVQTLSFLVMKMFGVTRCLFSRSCSRDGDGFAFNTSFRAPPPPAS